MAVSNLRQTESYEHLPQNFFRSKMLLFWGTFSLTFRSTLKLLPCFTPTNASAMLVQPLRRLRLV
jgi:hypothetical protein